MTTLEERFAAIHAEEEARGDRLVAMQYRKFLVGALCTVCGEPLGEAEGNAPWIIQNDDGETMHARCEEDSHLDPRTPQYGVAGD